MCLSAPVPVWVLASRKRGYLPHQVVKLKGLLSQWEMRWGILKSPDLSLDALIKYLPRVEVLTCELWTLTKIFSTVTNSFVFNP